MSLKHKGRLLRGLLRGPVFLFRWHMGWLLGNRFLLLTHTGRRSGCVHRTVLEVLHYDRAREEPVVLSGWGARADWYRNVLNQNAARVTLGRHDFDAVPRVLAEPEALTILDDYVRRNRWLVPVINRVLSSLLGWRYDGSEQSRRRLVHELPLVAFSPCGRADD